MTLDIKNVIDTYSTLINIFFWLVSLIGVYLAENRYNISNKIKKKIAYYTKDIQIELIMRFEKNVEFEITKHTIKNYLLNKYKNYRLLNENEQKLSIFFDIFTIEIRHDKFNEIYFEVLKSECGIKQLKIKIENIIDLLNELNNVNKSFDKFISCDIFLYFPYSWTYLKIYEPKGFELDDYRINMKKKDGFKTNVEIRLNNISSSVKSFAEINPLLEKLL